MKYAIIENETVVNIALSDEALAYNWIPIDSNDVVDIGYRYDNDAADFIPVEKDNSEEIRALRDAKLKESDWTQVADAPVDQAAWATYRQALRDVPEQESFPVTVNWPVEP